MPYKHQRNADIKTDTKRDTKEFVCGFGAAFINVTLTFPINKIMFRQQLHGIRTAKAVGELQKEGFRNLYRGLLLPLLHKTTSLSIMFGSYDKYRRILASNTTWRSSHICGTAALLSGFTEALLCPFERIQTLMQDKAYHQKFTNTFHAAVELRSHGFREYYRGMFVILLRNGPSNAAFFLLRKPIKESMPETDSRFLGSCEDFISGALLGACISTAFYPLNVVKTRMQSVTGKPYTGTLQTFWTVFHERDRNWRKMFRGVQINFTRSLLSWGIINASYELLWQYL